MWLKTTRITLLVALLLAVAILAYLAGHPRLYSGHIGRLVTRHVLERAGWTFQCRDLGGNPLGHMVFYDVTLTHDSSGGDFAYISCDSLEFQYDLRAILRRDLRLPLVAIYQPQITLRRGSKVGGTLAPASMGAPRLEVTRLEIDELLVQGGSASILASDQSLEERLDDFELSASLRSEMGSLHVELRELSARWPTRGIERLRLRADAQLRQNVLVVQQAVVHLDSMRAEGDMRLDFTNPSDWNGNLTATAMNFRLDRLMALFGKEVELDLLVDGVVEMTLARNRFTLTGVGSGSVAGYPFNAERVEVTRAGDVLSFDHLEGEFLHTPAIASGRFSLRNKRLELSGVVEQLDLAEPWLPGSEWPESSLRGKVDIVLDTMDGTRFELVGDMISGSIFGTTVDSVQCRLVATEAGGVELESLDGRILNAWVDLSGTIDAEENCDILARLRTENAGALLNHFGVEGAAKRVSMAGTIHGPLDDPSLTASALADTVIRRNLRGIGCDAQVEIAHLRTERTVRGNAAMESFLVADTSLGSVHGEFRRLADRLEIDRLEFARGDTTLHAALSLKVVEGEAELGFRRLDFGLADHGWELDGASTVRIAPRHWSTESIGFASASGVVHLRGAIDLDGDIDVNLSVKRGDLGFLSWAGLLPAKSTGQVSASIAIGGLTAVPELDVQLDIRDATIHGDVYDSAQLHLRSQGQSFTVETLAVRTNRGELRVSGGADLSSADWLRTAVEDPQRLRRLFETAQLDLTVSVDSLRLAEWLPDAEGFGILSGSLEIGGSAETPLVRGDVDLIDFANESVVLPAVRATVVSDATSIRLVDGWLMMPEPWLSFEAELPVELRMTQPPRLISEDRVHFTLFSDGPTQLSPLTTCIPAIEQAEGTLDIRYEAVGSWDDAQLSGRVRIDADKLRIENIVEPFRDIELRGDFLENRFRIRRAVAKEGEKGRIEARGDVIFAGLIPDDIEIEADIYRFLLLSVPDLRAIVTSTEPVQLRLERPMAEQPRVLKFTGAVLIDRALYVGEFRAGPEGVGAGVLTPTAAPDWMAELQIQLRDQVRISNSIAELHLSGDIDLVRDLSGLRLRGVAEISQGSVTIAQLLDFGITQGRLDFSRGTGLEPEVELTAETEVPVYNSTGVGRELELVTVRVTGTFSEPQLSFSSVTGYDEKTIINLLAGIPVDSGAEDVRIQAMALRLAGNQIGRELAGAIRGIDTVQVETGDPTLDAGAGTQIGVGKYMDLANKPLYVRYSQGLSISERDIYVEYQLRRRFLLTFELRRRLEEAVAQTSVSADLKFRVEY